MEEQTLHHRRLVVLKFQARASWEVRKGEEEDAAAGRSRHLVNLTARVITEPSGGADMSREDFMVSPFCCSVGGAGVGERETERVMNIILDNRWRLMSKSTLSM